ncbi:hypothetical protein Bca52824_027446 [Brassica carinata]|uniref:Uncharacterized protein n=1 Tax=Brassica carinata TaxID=52824 RepID=A0A8X7VAI0_BRACI|nr:hypothetical protein Bca52824_027446 [Brassica carinata]
MSGTPDLSALLKGKLQLLKKSATTGSPTRLNEADASPKERSESPEQAVDADPPAAEPAKKRSQKKGGKKNVPSKGKKDPKDGSHSGEGSLEGSQVEKKKKKTKRSREGHGDGEGRDGLAEDSTGTTGVRGSPAELHLGDVLAGTKSPYGPRNLPIRNPGSEPHCASLSEGSLGKRPRIDFSDRVEFSYNEGTPLVCNPGQRAELSRQIRGGPRELPPVDDLVFKDDYIEASLAQRTADGSVNVLVEKYDTALKQTMTELGASVKLSRVRLGVIERLRADQERINKNTLEEKEALRAKFEGLEAALKADRAAKKELARSGRHGSFSDADLAKVVEVHDSSPDEEEESDDEEELPLSDPVQTEEPPQEQEKEEELVSADALHPEASLPPAPIVEDPSAPKEPSA